MPWAVAAAAIGAGAAIYSSDQQSDASHDAANVSANAQDRAVNTQLSMYNQTRSDLAPFLQGGAGAFSQLQTFLGPGGPMRNLLGLDGADPTAALRATPGYQFAVDQGQQAVERSAAARGTQLSGGTLKDLTTFGQGQADQLYGSQLQRYGTYAGQLQNESTTGANAGAQVGTAGSSAGGQIGNVLTQGSQLQGNEIMAGGNASASGIGGAANNIGTILNNSSLQAYLKGAVGGGSGFDMSQIP